MFYNDNFKKSIILMHQEYIKNKQSVKSFINIIKNIFYISRSTFYNWFNNKEIVNLEIQKTYKNNKITPMAEQIIILNKTKTIKKIKEELKKVNILLNVKAIRNVMYNNKTKLSNNTDKIPIINKDVFIKLAIENEKFLVDNCEKQIKTLIKEFINKFNIIIHEKQVVNVLHKHRKKTSSFYKRTPELVEYIIKKIKENSIYTIENIKDLIVNEFKLNISSQLIYNILKKQNFVYKKLKKINNPYEIEQQVLQLEKVNEKHNLKNIDNCVSLDEISIIINSKPTYGWFEKNTEANFKLKTPKITNKRYTILMASNNKKILHYIICNGGIKTESFISFMKELKNKNDNDKSYYLLDNCVVHKTKKFINYASENKLNIVYNAPYHSETNPIENIFSMFRNKINRNENNNQECIKTIRENFIKENNEIKFKNIFEHSVKMIESFIKNNKK